jgi:hypothetical protein
MEASVVGGESAAEQGRQAMLNVVYDALNQVESPDHFFDLEECELKGSGQPSLKAVTAFVRRHLETADYDAMLGVIESSGLHALPAWTFEDNRLRLVIRPIPKHDARGEPGVRPIGVYPVEGGWINMKDALRRRLAEKARNLRSVGMPLVLALNAVTKWGTDRDDIVDALFGSEQVVVDVNTRNARPSRARDGFFMGPTGPVNTRVSAVMVTTVFPRTAARAEIDIYANPWRKVTLPEGVLPFRTWRVVDGRLSLEEGRTVGDVLRLPDSWPEACDSNVPQ